jgi:hypothetical protein
MRGLNFCMLGSRDHISLEPKFGLPLTVCAHQAGVLRL